MKHVSQIREDWVIFFLLVGVYDLLNYLVRLWAIWRESIQEKETQSTYGDCSKCSQTTFISIFMWEKFHIKDQRSIVSPLISFLHFLLFREKAHHNEDFSREKFKTFSWFTDHDLLSRTLSLLQACLNF